MHANGVYDCVYVLFVCMTVCCLILRRLLPWNAVHRPVKKGVSFSFAHDRDALKKIDISWQQTPTLFIYTKQNLKEVMKS